MVLLLLGIKTAPVASLALVVGSAVAVAASRVPRKCAAIGLGHGTGIAIGTAAAPPAAALAPGRGGCGGGGVGVGWAQAEGAAAPVHSVGVPGERGEHEEEDPV